MNDWQETAIRIEIHARQAARELEELSKCIKKFGSKEINPEYAAHLENESRQIGRIASETQPGGVFASDPKAAPKTKKRGKK